GIDFNSGSPVAVTGGAMSATEGCATISTSEGNLLFYTDGITVWNKLNTPMPNGTGLLGGNSSTQAAIIIPQPGDTNMYYIFTTPSYGDGYLSYSQVDMSLAGGLGDITSTKNILLYDSVSEKLTAVKNSNNKDIWVIAHRCLTSDFLAYAVTSDGVSATPVISSAGTLYTGASDLGYLKPSSNGSKLVAATATMNSVDLLHFNTSTGIVTTYFSFVPALSFPVVYGAEFSPDDSRLYVASFLGTPEIYQYDMTLASPAAIISSATLIGTSIWTGSSFGALQNGPDGKMYIAENGFATIACISNPNALGILCNYAEYGVHATVGASSRWGLPNSMKSYPLRTFENHVQIPNIFTPNGDNQNDIFYIKNLQSGIAKLSIYNRWGNIVYFSSAYNNDWNGDGCCDGTYYYILNDPKNDKTYKGFIEILRSR
ncbi:MAG: gliding motility-associated C-terminal domain-containing protein, partial [Bacteroidia bacterium]